MSLGLPDVGRSVRRASLAMICLLLLGGAAELDLTGRKGLREAGFSCHLYQGALK